MTSFLLYIARAGLYLGLFYAFYLLVMRRTTFFQLNRVLLLCGSFLCLALPFFRLRTVATAGIASELSMVAGAETVQEAVRAVFPWKEVLLGLYLVGALATLTLYALSARKIMRMMHRGESTRTDEGYRLILLDEDVPSFSWGQRIVMSRKDLAENNRFWEQFEGAAAETHEKINDAYLRANGQQEGVKSYGRMVDLMLAWARVHPFS